MSHWRRLNYSISIAVLLTALAGSFFDGVGGFLAIPGILLEMWTNIVILMMSKEEYPFQFNNWMGFSILFYAATIYFVVWLYTIIKRANVEVAIK
jgi:hypothetical protein